MKINNSKISGDVVPQITYFPGNSYFLPTSFSNFPRKKEIQKEFQKMSAKDKKVVSGSRTSLKQIKAQDRIMQLD